MEVRMKGKSGNSWKKMRNEGQNSRKVKNQEGKWEIRLEIARKME